MILPYKGVSPRIHRSVFMVESAAVIGDVEIGPDSSLWFNSVTRGDVNYIRIGALTNVQDNSTLHVTKDTHPLVIGDEVTIGHGVTLHGCTVLGRALIGMGAIVLDGAEIGMDVIVGAGTLITEGKVIPPRTLVVGSPGRVVRDLTDAEVERIRRSAANYKGYAENYRAGGYAGITEES